MSITDFNTIPTVGTSNGFSNLLLLEQRRLWGNVGPPDLSQDYQVQAVAYVRVSTKLQAQEDKASLPEQINRAREVAKREDWQLIQVYQDAGKSGTSLEHRDGLQQLINDARKGLFSVVIVWDYDRLGRNYVDVGAVREHLRQLGIQTYAISTPASIQDPRIYNPKDDEARKILEHTSDLFSEMENNKRAKRMAMGKMKVAQDGKIPCKVPYGYIKKKVIFTENGRQKIQSVIEPDGDKLSIVSEMFRLYDEAGYGIRKVVRWLNDQGVSSPTGKKWDYSAIKYVLQNPTYTGVVRWGWRLSQNRESRRRLSTGHQGVICKGKHASVITQQVFERVQLIMKSRNKIGGAATASRGLLTGILKCGICHKNAHVTSFPHWYAYQQRKHGKDTNAYKKTRAYVCSTTSRYGNKACKRYIMSQDKLEGRVVKKIKQFADNSAAKTSFIKEYLSLNKGKIKQQLHSLQKELNSLPAKRQRHILAYEQQIETIEDYSRSLERLRDEEVKLQQQISSLKSQLTTRQEKEGVYKLAQRMVSRFNHAWVKATFPQKKSLISILIEEITVRNSRVSIKFKVE